MNIAEVEGQSSWEANVFRFDITRSMFSFSWSMLQWNCFKYLVGNQVESFLNSPFPRAEKLMKVPSFCLTTHWYRGLLVLHQYLRLIPARVSANLTDQSGSVIVTWFFGVMTYLDSATRMTVLVWSSSVPECSSLVVQ